MSRRQQSEHLILGEAEEEEPNPLRQDQHSRQQEVARGGSSRRRWLLRGDSSCGVPQRGCSKRVTRPG